MSKLLCIAALSMSLLGVASAGTVSSTDTQCRRGSSCPTPYSAPEVGAGSFVAGLTLLLGGLAVLRGRQTKSN